MVVEGVGSCPRGRRCVIDLNQEAEVVVDGPTYYKVSYLGQLFDDDEMTYSFYLEYAYALGFGVRKYNHNLATSLEVGLLRSHGEVSTMKHVLTGLMDGVNIDAS